MTQSKWLSFILMNFDESKESQSGVIIMDLRNAKPKGEAHWIFNHDIFFFCIASIQRKSNVKLAHFLLFFSLHCTETHVSFGRYKLMFHEKSQIRVTKYWNAISVATASTWIEKIYRQREKPIYIQNRRKCGGWCAARITDGKSDGGKYFTFE